MGTSNKGDKDAVSVAVVVLNWRRYDETLACLRAVSLLERPARVFLVDNESDPAGLAQVRARFPSVATLPQEQNLGYAEGMNVGLEAAIRAGASHILLLNNDARVTPPVVDRLLALFRVHADAGVVGPSIRFPEPDGRIEALGMDVNPYSGRIVLRHHGASPDDVFPYPHKVDAVPGTAMMVSTDLVERAGMFDPAYFAYFEDVELCLRAREKGFATYVFPKAVVYHAGAATLGSRPERVYYSVRNHLWVMDEHGKPLTPALRTLRRVYIAGLHAAQVLRERGTGPRGSLAGLARGIRDYRAGLSGPWRRAVER